MSDYAGYNHPYCYVKSALYLIAIFDLFLAYNLRVLNEANNTMHPTATVATLPSRRMIVGAMSLFG